MSLEYMRMPDLGKIFAFYDLIFHVHAFCTAMDQFWTAAHVDAGSILSLSRDFAEMEFVDSMCIAELIMLLATCIPLRPVLFFQYCQT